MENSICLQFAIIILLLYHKADTTLQEIQSVNGIVINVITTNKTGTLKRFWLNTGLSAPGPGKSTVDYLESSTQQFNIALIGSLPFSGLSHIRIHWLLDLISVLRYAGNSSKIYDFNRLDKLISYLYKNGLRPAFEIMGNPGGMFSNLENNTTQIEMWKDLIYTMAARFKDKYGLEEVQKWRFETWNEPDLKMYNNLNLTLSGYLNYVNASREGLKACSPKLQLYGPAGVFKSKLKHQICWGLLGYCENQIAQNRSSLIDVVTFHKKGNGSVEGILEESLNLYKEFQSLFPKMAELPFANDEADVLTGWWREEEWRTDVRYAAAVCQSVAQFHKARARLKLPLQYISNDNAFLNVPPAFFSQRTLLTRFVIKNTDGSYHDQFIRKPVYIAMALLAHLGGVEVETIVRPESSKLSVLASCTESLPWSCAILLAFGTHLDINTTKTSLDIKVKLPKHSDVKYFTYILDNNLPHPADVWNRAGRPAMPRRMLLKKMRKAEGPHRVYASSLYEEDLNLQLGVTIPSITLVNVCSRPSHPPGQVILLPAMNVTYNEVLLLWKDTNVKTRCIKTYELEFCQGNCNAETFVRINKIDIILLSFQFIANTLTFPEREATIGLYRVRAMDYWEQASLYSNVIHYGL